jgi:2-keto-4-pentenoate hydratase
VTVRPYHLELAQHFVSARQDQTSLQPPRSEQFLDLEGAYAVQRAFADLYSAQGRQVAGYKISATSDESQATLGILEPIMGVLFDDDVLHSPASIPLTEFQAPLAEAELVFVLTDDLPELCNRERIIANSRVAPGIELPDSRLAGWPGAVSSYSVEDIVADNTLSGKLVLGPDIPTAEVDLLRVQTRLRVDGRPAMSSAASSILDDPVRAVGWIARAVHRLDRTLTAGTVIATGALVGPVPVSSGLVEADFGDLGTVSVVLS